MKQLLLNLVVILLIIQSARGHSGHISCYKCEGLEKHCTKATLAANPYRYLHDCGEGRDRCTRIWQITSDHTALVQNLCANERLCDKMEKLCANLKKKEDYKCSVSCCHDDACNSADTGVNFSLHLVILCIAFGVIEALNFT